MSLNPSGYQTPAALPATDRPLVAVLDIGKTNANLVVADPRSGRQIWSRAQANRPLVGAPYLAIDAAAIEAFVLAALRDAGRCAEIGAILPVAHGACAALVTPEGLALPGMVYEGPEVGEVIGPCAIHSPIPGRPSFRLGSIWAASSISWKRIFPRSSWQRATCCCGHNIGRGASAAH